MNEENIFDKKLDEYIEANKFIFLNKAPSEFRLKNRIDMALELNRQLEEEKIIKKTNKEKNLGVSFILNFFTKPIIYKPLVVFGILATATIITYFFIFEKSSNALKKETIITKQATEIPQKKADTGIGKIGISPTDSGIVSKISKEKEKVRNEEKIKHHIEINKFVKLDKKYIDTVETIANFSRKLSFGFSSTGKVNEKTISGKINSLIDRNIEFKYLNSNEFVSEWFYLKSKDSFLNQSRFRINSSNDSIILFLEKTNIFKKKNRRMIIEDSLLYDLKKGLK